MRRSYSGLQHETTSPRSYGLGLPTMSRAGWSPVGGENSGHLEMAVSVISTRLLEIISNRSGGNARSPGKRPFPHFQGHFRGHGWHRPSEHRGSLVSLRPNSDKYLDVPAPNYPGMTFTLPHPPSSCWFPRPDLGKLTPESNDPIYLVDSDPIKLCDLAPRHTVVRQGAHATELGDRYIAGLALGGRLSPYLLRFRRRFDFRRTHRHHRRDREDTWLSPRLLS
jgi:hypothetical protein